MRSYFVVVSIGPTGDAQAANGFIASLAARAPMVVRQVLTPDALPFSDDGCTGSFGATCRGLGIDHCPRPGQPSWPWDGSGHAGQEPGGGVIFEGEASLASIVQAFVHAYNFDRRQKALRGRLPFEALCQALAGRRDDPDLHHDLMKLEFMRR